MMKIIIAGAGLTGLTYALLLKIEGYEVEIYEKRTVEEIDNLDSVIFIKEKTLTILSKFIDDAIFSGPAPKAYKEGPRKGVTEQLSIKGDHACINIADLLHALIDSAKRAGIPIHRQYELQFFSRKDNKTHLVFKHGEQQFETQCDQLLLACGNRSVKSILKDNKFRIPVELHSTNVLGVRIPIDHKNIDRTNRASIGLYPDYSTPTMAAAQFSAYFFNYCPMSVGNFSLYLTSPNKFAFMSTCSPEQVNEFKTDSKSQVNFLRTRLKNLRTGYKIPEMNYAWLEEMDNKINEKNIVLVNAYAAVHVPDKSLLKQGVISIGDAYVTTPFIFGSEFNEHVQNAYPSLVAYLNYLRIIKNETEKDMALDSFIEAQWSFITNKNYAARYLEATDSLGNTLKPDGSRVNISPYIGYPLSRKKLEEQSHKFSSWVQVPQYQDGGFLSKTESVMQSDESIKNKNQDTEKNNLRHFSFFAKAGIIAGAVVLSEGLRKIYTPEGAF